MHKGVVLPLPASEKKEWALLQEKSDEEDAAILFARERLTEVEPASYSKSIGIQTPVEFVFPKPEHFELSNGMKVFYYKNATTPKRHSIVEFKARSYYDHIDKQGL